MRSIEAIGRELDIVPPVHERREAARRLLSLAEEVLEAWVTARGDAPTEGLREGFRLLALHHQGARGLPSFNACRETCREILYHHNLLLLDDPAEAGQRLAMMVMLVRHLALFVGGKLQVEGLGDFCCASRPVRQNDTMIEKAETAP
jgi:hypothetical protein